MYFFLFFVKQKTAYELRISDWSSDVCSSDLPVHGRRAADLRPPDGQRLQRRRRRRPAHRRPAREDDRGRESPVHAGLLRSRQALNRQFRPEIGRASCRERVCQYVSVSVVALSLKQKNKNHPPITIPTT